jgi:predicted nucleic acid-binding protein
MNPTILLDAGPLGMVTNPRAAGEARECRDWLRAMIASGVAVLVPEIADYEVRRELLRAGKTESVQRLSELGETIGYVPLTTETMLRAAEFWAQVRKLNRPTADAKALDGDVILAAQAAALTGQGHEVVIATTNVDHLALLANAKEWREIHCP